MTNNTHSESLDLNVLLANQQQAYRANPAADLNSRILALKNLKQAVLTNQKALTDAMATDFGHRSENDSIIGDIMPIANAVNYTVKQLKKWMKPSRRHAGMLLSPAKVSVHYQPLGVVGIIVPWNFPIMLSLGPLITALAAGNRAMLKMSEFTPATNKVLGEILAGIFDTNQVAIVEGEADVAAAFSSLPFDHIIFTGSTAVGKHVMRAAANNLTPVTLELGGKSPVIIADDIDIKTAVERMIYGKCLNAGQICVAPDYVLCPESKVDAFISEYCAQFQKMYQQSNDNDDYSSIIDDRQYSRLADWLEDAETRGATIVSADGSKPDQVKRRIATHLITNVSDDMALMTGEIFGPLLPVIPYQSLDSAIDYINSRPRPLALYLMSHNTQTQNTVLNQTHSGGVCINETVFHVAADDAPFGGIGPSGMGHYHGKEGFLALSKAKTVLKRGKTNTGKLVFPPYGTGIQKLMFKLFLR
ncbi:Coniferyl aldehyde dehydrogenase [Sinobacterium norvegicum]|uniref:Aldehyde dehydrogenase n=1 Tax=Sinobacterium norvegicum TaxID=1641715 RepID=A0ABM9AC29_9GAMM|nr:coniferyl aldehyde dehydrogenase [Sinobacterium norvegicum]CAH0990447.1 Coniferyl aldehyde dehydrogenase [Sinobacterium norvegicum]